MSFQLQHLNLPARDPQGLARGSGVLLAFQRGEPINNGPIGSAGP